MQTSGLDEGECENPTSFDAGVESVGFDPVVHEPAVNSPPLRQLFSDDSFHAQHRRVLASKCRSPRLDSLEDHCTSSHRVTSSCNGRWNDDCQDVWNCLEESGTSCATRNFRAAPSDSLALNITHSADTDRVDDRSIYGHGGNEHRTGLVLYATTRNMSHHGYTDTSNKTNIAKQDFSDGTASAAANTLGTAVSTADLDTDSKTVHNSGRYAYNVSAGIEGSKEDSCTVHLPTLTESPKKAPDLLVPNLFLDDLKRRWEIFQRKDETLVNQAGSFRFRQQVEKKSKKSRPDAQCKESVLPKLS